MWSFRVSFYYFCSIDLLFFFFFFAVHLMSKLGLLAIIRRLSCLFGFVN